MNDSGTGQRSDAVQRIATVLRALAVGDALGRATEHYTADEIVEVYEDLVTDFVEPVRLFDDESWEEGEVGPPTSLVIEAVEGGARPTVPAGAAPVERLPVGVALGLLTPLADIVQGVVPEPALACIAAGIAGGLAGLPPIEVVAGMSRAARVAGGDALAEAVLEAGGIAQSTGGSRPGRVISARFPPSGDPTAVTAFVAGIVYATQSARRGIVEAANQGGHAPETAGIAGAICAAIAPLTLPSPWGTLVERLNGLDLEAVARRYAALRGEG